MKQKTSYVDLAALIGFLVMGAYFYKIDPLGAGFAFGVSVNYFSNLFLKEIRGFNTKNGDTE